MAKEKLIVNIRFGFEEAPAEIDLKKLTSTIAFNYLLNCRPGPIAWLEVTAENKETKETGVYRHPFAKGKKDNDKRRSSSKINKYCHRYVNDR